MMQKLYNQMATEKAGRKAGPLVEFGGNKREKKENSMAVPVEAICSIGYIGRVSQAR